MSGDRNSSADNGVHLQPVVCQSRHDFLDLSEIVLRVCFDLLRRQADAGLVPAARVTDEGGVIADDEDGLVAQLLKDAELA